MQYGVLDNPDTIDAFFYIKKDSRNTDNDSRLKLLTNKIIRQKRYPVHAYSTIDDITSQVDKDFMYILNTRYPEIRQFDNDEVKYRQSLYKNHFLDFYFDENYNII